MSDELYELVLKQKRMTLIYLVVIALLSMCTLGLGSYAYYLTDKKQHAMAETLDAALDEQHEAIQKVYDFVNNVRRRGY